MSDKENPPAPSGFTEAKTRNLDFLRGLCDPGNEVNLKKPEYLEVPVSGDAETRSGFGLYGTIRSIDGIVIGNGRDWIEDTLLRSNKFHVSALASYGFDASRSLSQLLYGVVPGFPVCAFGGLRGFIHS